MPRCPRTRITAAFLALLLSTIFAGGVAAQTSPDDARLDMLARINDLMSRDERLQALPLCRQYAREYPADHVMLYNLACLENTVGEPERAAESFAAAVAAGFDDFDLANADPDLQGGMRAVVRSHHAAYLKRLTDLAERQALTLDLGTWSPPRPLLPHGAEFDLVPDAEAPAQLRLRWQDANLEIELTADPAWAAILSASTQTPWRGGPALLVSLSVPDSASAWEASNHFLFAFGIDAKGSVGGMFVMPQQHWQPIAELLPKIKDAGDGRLRLTTSIPWQALMPYDPVVDTPLGINATLVEPGNGGRRVSLVATDDTLDPLATRRRFARLTFRTDSIDGERFAGRMSDSISRTEPLDLDLIAIAQEAGEALLSLNFMDQSGRSVLPDGPVTGRLTLQKGTNRLRRQADFRSLNLGGYILQTELTFPSGAKRTWGATVLHLPDRWRDRYEEQASFVAVNEQKTVRYHLDTVLAAIAHHQARRSPGAIVASLMDLDQMLADAADKGTILPDKGSFVMVYPGPDDRDRLCRLYLPAGREHSDGLNPVLILSDSPGPAARLAARLGRNYEYGTQKPTLKTGDDNRFPIYLIPEFGNGPSDGPLDLLAEAEACRSWAMTTFGSPVVSLVGIDETVATSLAMIKNTPASVIGLMAFAGAGLEPWPQAQPEYIRRQLGTPPPDLPITWLDFRMETASGGQAPEILRALKDLGFQIADEQEVRGSLSLSQVADRVVIWAEDLR